MNPAELAQMLEMMTAALRAMPAGAAVQAPQLVAPAATAAPQRTLAEWLDVHEQQISSKGLKPRQKQRSNSCMTAATAFK